MDRDEQALVLLTNRLLLDWISICVDQGQIEKAFAEKLIEFSAKEVVQGAPWLSDEVHSFAKLFKERLPSAQAD